MIKSLSQSNFACRSHLSRQIYEEKRTLKIFILKKKNELPTIFSYLSFSTTCGLAITLGVDVSVIYTFYWTYFYCIVLWLLV